MENNPPIHAAIKHLLWDAKTTHKKLRMSDRYLWSLTACRAIPSRKIGRSVRYVPAEIEAWIAAGCPTEPNSADWVLEEMRP